MSITKQGRNGRYDPIEASSSSSREPYHGRSDDDASDASDLDIGDDLLSSDPMNGGDLAQTTGNSYSRDPPSAPSFRFHTSPPSRSASPSPANNTNDHSAQPRRRTSFTPRPISIVDTTIHTDSSDSKDPAPSHDWYPENHSRLAVPYDDLTAIDWIHEYSKERARVRHLRASHTLSNSTATTQLLTYARQLADDSQSWLILVATGFAVGAIAAAIDVVVDWLADLKTGACKNHGDGGTFYLNKVFCCWGYDDYAQCPDWNDWSQLMHIQNTGAAWIVNFLFYLIFSVTFASVAAFLVNRFSPYARQSGIPEIKTLLGGFVIKKFLGVSTLITKSLGLCLAVASGLVLGKEGPLVHVACCCANLFMKPFVPINTNEARRREVLSAAAASGISVAFGAPVGGVLFSLEQLSYYFPDKTMWQSFVCAMIAAFTLKAFNPFRTGKTVQYQVTFHTGWHGFEIMPYIVIGILGGLYGGLFIKLNMRLARLRKSPRYWFAGKPILEVACIAALTAAITFPITFLRAQATELDYYLFAECIDITHDPLGLCKSGIANTGVIFLLLVSSLIAFVFASLTFGLQIPAGILLPSMTIGALYGRVVGLIVEVAQREHPAWLIFSTCEPDVPCVTPGTYAIIGAASALAGATRMTVSIVVIMFELTGALTYVLPIMIAVMIAKWVGDAVGKRGIYESWIHFHEYPFLDNREDGTVPDVPVSQIMTRFEDLVALDAEGDHTIESLRALLSAHKYRGFPVVQSFARPTLLGYLARGELAFALERATTTRGLPPSTPCSLAFSTDASTALDLRPWMDQTPITLQAAAGFALVVTMFQRLGLRYLVLVERGMCVGLLTKKDVWFVLNEDEIERGLDAADGGGGNVGAGVGVLRVDGEGESRGLLGRSGRGGDEDEDDGVEEGRGGRDGAMETGVVFPRDGHIREGLGA